MPAARRLPLISAAVLAIAAGWAWSSLGRVAQIGSAAPVAGSAATASDGDRLVSDACPTAPQAGLRSADSVPLALTRQSRQPQPIKSSDLAGAGCAGLASGHAGMADGVAGGQARGARSSVAGSLVARHVRLQV